MRQEFAQAMEKLYSKTNRHVFVTGDLGFMALEKVRDIYGKRFINAGVAEQNMISMSAGLAYSGWIPWVYSIAPFATLRPYEQIRNDICLHHLPVKIVGNGGGYGYGIMGATHHALEDVAVMRALPSMRIYVPFVATDVDQAVSQMAQDLAPNYLRLNQGVKVAAEVESFRPWRKVKKGTEIVMVGLGPAVGPLFELEDANLQSAVEVWTVGQLPLTQLPNEFLQSLQAKGKILVIEEHGRAGGLGEALAAVLLKQTNFEFSFDSICAEGYPSGKYGSQRWHQEQSALAGEPLAEKIRGFLHG